MNRNLEDKFFAEFGIGGAADMALDMVLWQYCKVGSGTATRAEHYKENVLAEIAERTEKAKMWLYDSNNGLSALYEEIEDNIRECDRISKDEIRRYVGKILQKFSWWAFCYNRWREGLNVIDNTVVNGSIEYYYCTWLMDYKSFAEKLAAILAERDISLEAIQEEYGVKIFDGFDIEKNWYLFGTRERAERILSKIYNVKVVPKQRGRKVGNFRDNIVGDESSKDKLLAKLHSLIDGKLGKEVALVIILCIQLGKITKPSFKQVENEFGDIGNKSGYNRYVANQQLYTDDEIIGMKRILEE